MLSQIVRPMVRTQIRLLANSQATRSTLVTTIAQWLGFLGVQAKVNHLDTVSNKIQLSLTVGKPEACDDHDWKQILENLNIANAQERLPLADPAQMTNQQKSKFYRLLAYVLQVGYPDNMPKWEELRPQIQALGFDEETLAGIRSALKVPQSIEGLMENIDPDVAAIALSKAVNLALLDRQVNPSEDKALSLLLDAMKQPS